MSEKISTEIYVIVKSNGKRVEAKEWFPHDEAFGYWAWSCRTLDRAMERLRNLERGQGMQDCTSQVSLDPLTPGQSTEITLYLKELEKSDK